MDKSQIHEDIILIDEINKRINYHKAQAARYQLALDALLPLSSNEEPEIKVYQTKPKPERDLKHDRHKIIKLLNRHGKLKGSKIKELLNIPKVDEAINQKLYMMVKEGILDKNLLPGETKQRGYIYSLSSNYYAKRTETNPPISY